MSAVRNFVLTLVISLLIFGFLAYGIMNFATDAFSIGGKKPTSESDNVQSGAITSDDIKPPNNELDTVQGDSYTVLFVGTNYMPDLYDDYNTTDKEINGFPAPLRTVDTDVLILFRVNKETGECIYTPIPSITKITLDGHPSTLSRVYQRKGINTLIDYVTVLTGLPIDFYAITDLDRLASIVDELGSVEFYVPENMNYSDAETGFKISLSKGNRKLDGEAAANMFKYYTLKNDEASKRKLSVNFLKAIINKLMSDVQMKDAASEYLKYVQHVETNFTSEHLTERAELIFSYPKMSIKDYTYPGKTENNDGKIIFIPSINEAKKYFDKYKFRG